MSDIKLTVAKRPARKPRKGRKPKSSPFDSPQLNVMLYQSTWTTSDLSSSTAGVISSTFSPTIQNSSEYSGPILSLFRQVKLIAFQLAFVPIHPSTRTADQMLIVSTDMEMNGTTAVNPSTAANVENGTLVRYISSATLTPVYYRMPVPNLMYSGVSADSPATETPWAGSPGVVKVYGSGFTASLAYFRVQAKAVYSLRGRT